MADKAGLVQNIEAGVVLCTWSNIDSTDDQGDDFDSAAHSDKCVQLTGTFTATTMLIEGSNDGTNYATLTDPQGNPLSFTAAGIEQILENPRYVRPRASASGGSTDVTVTIVARKTLR